jgi:hypothetical protein
MENELDFSNISLNDVKISGQSIAANEPAVEPAATDAAPPASNPAPDPAPTAEPAPEPEPARASEPAREYQWKDDFIKGVVEFYEKTGDITPYLQAKLVDFNGMSDEEVMRRNLREQYPDVSEKAFERLYKQQIVDKFKLDSEEWGEEDSDLGRELLKAEATKARQKYIEWQNGFMAPEPVVSDEAKQEEAQLKEAFQKFEQDVRTNKMTSQLLNDKRIAIKVGDAEFNYELSNPNEMVDLTLDNNKFFSQFAAGDGQLDYSKWYKTVAYSQNPELFEKALINYGKTLGREEVTKEIKNPSSNAVGDVPTEDTGDFTTGLLNAFLNRGISK